MESDRKTFKVKACLLVNIDSHVEESLKDKYPYVNFTTCSIRYNYSNFNAKDKTLGPLPREKPPDITTSGNVLKNTNITWTKFLTIKIYK